MLKRIAALLAFAGWLSGVPTGAARAQQEIVFIQLQAHPSLAIAQGTARAFASEYADVAAFSLGSGWYGVALGPYPRADGEARLRDLLGRGLLPPDAYIQEASSYGEQIWPLGADRDRTLEQMRQQTPEGEAPGNATVAEQDAPVDQSADGPSAEGTSADDTIPSAPPNETLAQSVPPGESPAEARRSERALGRAEREEIQRALQWAGYYTAGIDAAFGRGTRAAMSAWQRANGVEVTGVLTTRQRGELLRQFYAVFDGLGLERVADGRAGISMDLPMGVVSFDRIESPFAIYTPTRDLPVRVLLISQPGDRQSLGGLYEIMQTLEIVPPEGPRDRRADGFTLTGRNDEIVSHTEVTLQNGAIKGFTLIWPAGDEARRTRVLDRMAASVTRIPGTLDPARITDARQSVDLVAGLRVRRPVSSASGVFVDGTGRALTARGAVAGCGRVTLDSGHAMRVAAMSDTLGLALLAPEDRLAPRRVAQFRVEPARLQSEIAVAGYPFGGRLGAPTLTFGRLAELQGLGGEDTLQRLELSAMDGDAGGPVLDEAGAVMGVLLPRDDTGGRRLPDGVAFAAQADAALAFLERSGVDAVARGATAPIAPEDLTTLAGEMTVLVNCWD